MSGFVIFALALGCCFIAVMMAASRRDLPPPETVVSDAEPEVPTKSPYDSYFEMRRQWAEEFEANRLAAIAALPEEPPYRIAQGNDGWWRVSRYGVRTSPRYFGEFEVLAFYRFPPPKPSVSVQAYGIYDPFAPTFLTKLEAEQWLATHVEDTPKAYLFDKHGERADSAQTFVEPPTEQTQLH